MKYVSTRGTADQTPRSFCDILLEGLAPDGGLYVPERYPRLDKATLADWRRTLTEDGYPALAFEVLRLFIDDISDADLRRLTQHAYAPGKFSDPKVVTTADIGDGMALGRISNGPTAAFKDMAMQLLGELFEFELGRRGQVITIVGATSGDTGSAAEYAMKGKRGVTTFMLTPRGRMTPFQQAQMFTLDDPRIINVAVDGVFDDCQDLVKAVNSDLAFKAEHHLGAVNSINWARLVAQVVYYVALWLRVTDSDDQRVSFAVPSGNFGNICAGHVAREMGLPIDTLVLATNENNVLDEFFRTGVYRIRTGAETHETSSPSMDISKASNFERFVFDLLGRDGERVRQLFVDELSATGAFDLSGLPEFGTLRERYGFVSGSSTHADRLDEIRRLFESRAIIIDPHTADGVHVVRTLRAEGVAFAEPAVVLETALAVKFSETINEALGHDVERPASFAGLEDLPRRVVDLDNDEDALKALIRDTLAALRAAPAAEA
ncbi:threonine synthase [Nigerium massiliense]|uniref:threonine synthase n=1 Tax=Nigerium massiliense TaxID=1522317 RepID=UPI0005902134|nr:threonine synthase [Nigerium massiliense]